MPITKNQYLENLVHVLSVAHVQFSPKIVFGFFKSTCDVLSDASEDIVKLLNSWGTYIQKNVKIRV